MDKELIRQVISEYEDSESMRLQKENIQKLNKIILGNGEVGLCEKVRILETSFRLQMKPLKWLISILILAIITGTITVMIKGG